MPLILHIARRQIDTTGGDKVDPDAAKLKAPFLVEKISQIPRLYPYLLKSFLIVAHDSVKNFHEEFIFI